MGAGGMYGGGGDRDNGFEGFSNDETAKENKKKLFWLRFLKIVFLLLKTRITRKI